MASRSAKRPLADNAEFVVYTTRRPGCVKRGQRPEYHTVVIDARGPLGEREAKEIYFSIDDMPYLSDAVDTPEVGLWIWSGRITMKRDGEGVDQPSAENGDWRRPNVDELRHIAQGTWRAQWRKSRMAARR